MFTRIIIHMYILLSVILSSALVAAAVRKLTHRPHVVDSYARVGVPEWALNWLAGLLLVGAVGVLVGIWWSAIGVAVSSALVGYFAIALLAHLRVKDYRNMATPVVYLGIAIALLTIHL